MSRSLLLCVALAVAFAAASDAADAPPAEPAPALPDNDAVAASNEEPVVEEPAASGGGGTNWGFRFYVTPISGRWMREEQVHEDASLEWACWVLEFLLSEASKVVAKGAVHNTSMYNALVRYLRTKGTPTHMKPKVVSLLTQLLVTPTMFPTDDKPDLKALEGIERAVMSQCSKSTSSLFLPQRLLQVRLTDPAPLLHHGGDALNVVPLRPSGPATSTRISLA